MDFRVFAQPLLMSSQVVAAMALFCSSAPRRSAFALRAGVSLALYLVGTVVGALLGFILFPQLTTTLSYPAQLVLFSVLPFLWVGIVIFCFDVTVSTAALLVSAGFSAQNIVSGFIGTFYVVAGGLGLINDVSTSVFSDFPLGLSLVELLGQLLVTAGIYLTCWHTLVRHLDKDWSVTTSDRKVALMFMATLLVDVLFDLSIKATYNYDVPVFHRTVFGITKIFICIFLLFAEFQILYAGRLEARVALERRLFQERDKQYHLNRDTIDAINVKCHDIRHQIRDLGQGGAQINRYVLDDIAHEVSIYDSTAHTGNEALDTILTEKGLACERAQIELGVMADGAALDFMEPAELYALFGNALDNAIEAVGPLEDPGKRSISLVVRRCGFMVSIHVENYYEGPLRIVHGLPQTTKGDRNLHGFGMRSMRATVERHGGSLMVNASDGLFRLDLLIPIPQQ